MSNVILGHFMDNDEKIQISNIYVILGQLDGEALNFDQMLLRHTIKCPVDI